MDQSIALVSGVSSVCGGQSEPFTFDEILTEYIAALPSFNKIWKALAGHAESSPPLFHLIFKLSADTFGCNQLGLRIPSVVG